MKRNFRKLYILLISLAVVVLVYSIANLINMREPIRIEGESVTGDVNDYVEFENEIGKIDDTGIVHVEGSTYQHRNERGEVDREIGFERVIRKVEDRWELDKPFINFYRTDMSCYITADKGDFQVETVINEPMPSDGALEGNVVIRVVPKGASEIKKSFIYLDDIVLDGERSMATSVGPIRLESENVQLTGKGLEFIYNEESGGLEYLRIIELERMVLRVSSKVSMFGPEEAIEGSGSVTQTGEKEAGEQARAADEQEQVVEPIEQEAAKGAELYRWIFSKNVVIDCPEQIVFADHIFINDILTAEPEQPQTTEQRIGEDVNEVPASDVVDVNKGAVAKAAEANEPAEQLMDIVVRCEGGILVTPMDSNIVPEPVTSEQSVTGGRGLARYGDVNDRAVLEAARIDYSAITNEAVLRGNCLAMMTRDENGLRRKYSLWAPRIKAEVLEDGKRDSSALASGLKHLRADGGEVVIAVRKLEEDRLLGFTKLSCVSFDYETKSQLCWATGPGQIEMDNSKMSQQEVASVRQKKTGRFSLQKPCYAIVQNFELLEYYLDSKQISADGGGESFYIGYMPVEGDREGNVVRVNIGHLDAQLMGTADGRTELVSMHASKGITYEEQGKTDIWGRHGGVHLVGSDLFYDREPSLITVWSDEDWPCTLNGVAVDGIKYNLRTGRLEKASVRGPGIIW